jgi:hypothetical protein
MKHTSIRHTGYISDMSRTDREGAKDSVFKKLFGLAGVMSQDKGSFEGTMVSVIC